MADVTLTILALPSANNSEITGVEYRVDGGAEVDSGLTDPFLGSFNIVNGSGKEIQWRAISTVGAGAWSASKVTQALPVIAIPDQNFILGQALPHSINVEDFNTGGPITTVSSAIGTVNGTVVTYNDVVTNQVDTIIASNASGNASDTLTVAIVDNVTSIAPTYQLGTQVAGGSGSPDSIPVSGGYAGVDQVFAIFVTSNSATPPTRSQFLLGTGGGIIQSQTIADYQGGQNDLDVFDLAATYVHALFEEVNNGGFTISSTALIDADLTPPVISGWITSTDGTQITGTFDETVTLPSGQPAAVDFTLGGVAGGSIGSVTIAGTSITLAVAGTPAGVADTITIAYTQGANTAINDRGHALESFPAESVANDVSAGPVVIYDEDFSGVSFPTTYDGAEIYYNEDPSSVFTAVTPTLQNTRDETTLMPTSSIGAIVLDGTIDTGDVAIRFKCVEGDQMTFYVKWVWDSTGASNNQDRLSLTWRDDSYTPLGEPYFNQNALNATTDVVAFDGVMGPFTAPAGTTFIELRHYARQNRGVNVITDLRVEKE